jgi:hypothetical protein
VAQGQTLAQVRSQLTSDYALGVRHVTEIGRWEITLTTGTTVEVWADGFQELDGFYVFGVLVDVDSEPDRTSVLVLNRTPANPARVIIALARFPVSAVAEIQGG